MQTIGKKSTTHAAAMHVPERIILTGRDYHYGSNPVSRELQLDNMMIPSDPEQIRIQTPPRSITLLDQQFPNHYRNSRSTDGDEDTLIVENDEARLMPILPNGRIGAGDFDASTSLLTRNQDNSLYDGEGLLAEMEHLRDQMSRLTVRVLTLEEDLATTKERETLLLIGALVCVTIQTCLWLFRAHH